MITREQWGSLHKHVTKRLETDAKFSISDQTLESMFGITHPFWEDMCVFANEIERNYTGDKHWITSDGEPTEIVYARKT
ncbi:hypothetical protein [Prosthecobacter sp.]|uniref:hypothetical protein n=1 Tax=Prosthecobacter sp. TaxID=1965333 RepID=UPI002ABB803C|nr:hypothetical protein [Prosthecobacter sp.]MDZ4404894.1 hypothetical protein [Prosthecobacter sp.]